MFSTYKMQNNNDKYLTIKIIFLSGLNCKLKFSIANLQGEMI